MIALKNYKMLKKNILNQQLIHLMEEKEILKNLILFNNNLKY